MVHNSGMLIYVHGLVFGPNWGFISYLQIHSSEFLLFEFYGRPPDPVECILNQDDQIHGVVIKGYHTYNLIFNTWEFTEKLLKKQQKLRFSRAGTWHQNGATEHTKIMLVNIKRTIMMHDALRCHKDTLSTDFSQWQWNILNWYTARSMICSTVYKLLGKFEPYMFWIQGCRSLEQKTLHGLKRFR